ncbi:formate dehydrogenase subunit delta [Methylomonas sp. MED-D]|uniref:Formate dehydrogenase n=1 Tax=Methylomonas koyamae TaxID=702114 RepID=A0A177NK91_9GAMM|nr:MULTISPECIES: formate dehydrogenase subunit delta [Methylomonas]NJA07302.1 formate dehydrogenase subunit delta [Methylococcaceae bacterium WWC4]MDT4332647.1 formate dehydrogenase subunit delta [Methylomonas sp. MV1]OAI17450.1 formate dehydrogenase [Methylomonas koyamae]OHX34551.1 formate dehydrogenase [Methylomonas sp. LWB]WGS85195.1 formate dehydrogenase subunit delta [Methylomonas sp. UP202]
MDNSNLVKMANNIGAFFQSEPEHDVAVSGVETHIRNFWEPRMRKQIVEYLQHGGNELLDIVAEAVKRISQKP